MELDYVGFYSFWIAKPLEQKTDQNFRFSWPNRNRKLTFRWLLFAFFNNVKNYAFEKTWLRKYLLTKMVSNATRVPCQISNCLTFSTKKKPPWSLRTDIIWKRLQRKLSRSRKQWSRHWICLMLKSVGICSQSACSSNYSYVLQTEVVEPPFRRFSIPPFFTFNIFSYVMFYTFLVNWRN